MRHTALTTGLLALVVAAAPACATKKFVRTSVGEVNSKVDTVSGTVEQTQGRVTAAEGRIGQVDSKAEAAGKAAATAQTSADAAAVAAKAADTKAAEVGTRVQAVEAAAKRLLLEVTLSEDQGNFEFGKAELPEQAKARLDDVLNRLKADPKSVFIEVEGHTDDRGAASDNVKLGLDRAEAVKRYVYENHKIPLHRVSVISFGEEKPVAPNKTKEGRAQNRRVVIRVLA
ncbi:MAG: OmpA family protein [Vicinamibacterales bacterium]